MSQLVFAVVLSTTHYAFAAAPSQGLHYATPPKPTMTIVRDPGAMAVLTDYSLAVRDTAWSDLKASGTFVKHLGTSDESGTATLWIQGSTAFRLDTNISGRLSSLRSNSSVATSSHSGRPKQYLSAKEADGGFVTFHMLRKSVLADQWVSLVDQGLVLTPVGNRRRISVQRPFSAQMGLPATDRRITPEDVFTVDLYFDPSTHLLLESATAFSPKGAQDESFLIVYSYEDYKAEGGILLPHRIVQVLNEQRLWTLTLTDFTLSQGLPVTTFQDQE